MLDFDVGSNPESTRLLYAINRDSIKLLSTVFPRKTTESIEKHTSTKYKLNKIL